MQFEFTLMLEAKKEVDRLLVRQYNRVNKYAERMSTETDPKKLEAAQAIIDMQFEELSKFKDWADTIILLTETILQNEQNEKNNAFSRGYTAAQKAKTVAETLGHVQNFRQFKEYQREQQKIKWADHL